MPRTPRRNARTVNGAPMPAFIEPCLATLTRTPPDGDAWIHEIKYDGYRIQAHIQDGDVRLYTRKGLDWSGRFASIAKALKKSITTAAILDGEVVVEDENGVSDFGMLVDALRGGNSQRMTYCVFDLLYLNREDFRTLPLTLRKAKLAELLAPLPRTGIVRYTDSVAREGRALFSQACKHGLEGIISKHADKPYMSGRGSSWLKSKCLQSEEFVIGGYVDSTAMPDAIGALLLGYYDGSSLRYAGRVGTGFAHETAHDLWLQLQKQRRSASAFSNALTAVQRRGVHWVVPKLVAQIDFRTVTPDGLLRHAAFKGLREDKPAREVTAPFLAKSGN